LKWRVGALKCVGLAIFKAKVKFPQIKLKLKIKFKKKDQSSEILRIFLDEELCSISNKSASINSFYKSD
jgi:hypothetical protein